MLSRFTKTSSKSSFDMDKTKENAKIENYVHCAFHCVSQDERTSAAIRNAPTKSTDTESSHWRNVGKEQSTIQPNR